MEALGKKKIIYLVIIAAAVVISFSPTLKHDFVNWDDDQHLTQNEHIRSLSFQNIKNIFTSVVNYTYVPLTLVSFAVEYQAFQYSPFIYHLNNVLLHLCTTILIFIVVQRLGATQRTAFFTALFFGTHPMHVEAVAWVTQRKDVLYACFYMLSILSYLNYLKNKKKTDYIYSNIFALLSVLAKPMALSLPLILFLCDWFMSRKMSKQVILEKIPYVLFIIPVCLITYIHHARNPIGDLSSILIWIWSFAFYIQKFLLPIHLTPLYALPKPVSLVNLPFIFAILIFLSVICAVFIARKQRWVVFAFLFYFLSIFFLLRFDDVKDVHIVADRFMYLPSLGFCILGGIFCNKWADLINQKRLSYLSLIAMGSIFLIFIVQTNQQCRIWQNSLTLWNHVIKHNPDSALAYVNRAKFFIHKKEFPSAMADLNKSLSIEINYQALNNRGTIYAMDQRYALALSDFSQAIALNRSDYFVYMNRARVYELTNEYNLAFKDYTSAVEINPDFAKGYFHRSLMFTTFHDYKAALNDALRAQKLGFSVDQEYVVKLQKFAQEQ